MRNALLLACRRLLKSAGPTLMIVLLVAMATASTASMFAVAESLLYKPLSYPAEQHLATVAVRATKVDVDAGLSVPFLETIARETRTFDAIAAYRVQDMALVDDNGLYAGEVKAIALQPALFALLGAKPIRGRLLSADDAAIGAPPSVVIGHELWRSHYGGDPLVTRRSVRIEGRDHRVVGVLPEGFGFPQRDRQVWLPLGFTEAERALSQAGLFAKELRAVGRLKPGQSMHEASVEMMRLARSDPELQRIAKVVGLELRAQPLRYLWVGDRESDLKLMLLAVLAVLAVITACVCNLYIVHVLKHRQELVLLAPGASFARRARQMLLCEIALLCTVGGAIGAALVPLGVRLLHHFDLVPTDMPQAIGGDLATVVFVVAIVAAMAAAMTVIGLRLQRHMVLRQAGKAPISRHEAQHLQAFLVMGQFALSLIFLVGTMVLAFNSHRLLNQDIGFERTELLVGRLQPLQSPQADDLPRQRAALAAWVEAVASMPEVDAVGLASSAPFGEYVNLQAFSPQGGSSLSLRTHPGAYITFVNAQHFLALGLPMVRGRAFEEGEVREGAPVAIIDADIAHKHFSGVDPIGKTLSVNEGAGESPVEVTVVGVVAVARQRALRNKDEYPSLYRPETVPYRLHGISVAEVEVLVRTRSASAALINALQDQVARVAPELRFVQLTTMDQRIADTIKDRLRLSALLQILGFIATLLTAIGLPILSEFGLPRELEADSRDIEKDDLAGGAWQIAFVLIVVIALPVAVLLPWIHPLQLSGDSPFDPVPWLVGLALYCLFHLIRLVAYSWLAYRAAKSKPMGVSRRD